MSFIEKFKETVGIAPEPSREEVIRGKKEKELKELKALVENIKGWNTASKNPAGQSFPELEAHERRIAELESELGLNKEKEEEQKEAA